MYQVGEIAGVMLSAHVNNGTAANVIMGLLNAYKANAIPELWHRQAIWSQETFGSNAARGPIGALKHLQKEASEAMQPPYDIVEYADCLMLILDAARRAGFTLEQLTRAAMEKLEVNKCRSWPKPTSDEPVHHTK